MNELTIFKNDQFGEVRTIIIESEPWFVGKDVADNLGYQNGSRDINRHVEEDDRRKTMLSDGTQMKETIIINESGLYSLILSSKLPQAKEFKRWVTAEVLPTIRKHGAYMTKETLKNCLSDPDFAIGLLNKLKEDEEKITALEAEKAVLLPKASYYDVILNSPGLMSVTQIAKDYGKSAKWLNQILAEEKIQFRQGDLWLLYQKYAEMGYAGSRTGPYSDTNGELCVYTHTYWTQKGRQFIYELLKNKRGIVPIMERGTEETA